MKSILVSHLEKNNPELLDETDYIAIKADDATIYYNELINKGIEKGKAIEESQTILFENI